MPYIITVKAGNFDKVLIWQFGEFGVDRQIKNPPTELNTCVVSIQIAKFKLCQYQRRAISPN